MAGVQQLPLWLDVSSVSRKCALRSLPVVHWWNCLRGCACDHRCRVLKADGVFFIVSYGTPENRLSYLENDEYKWHVTVHTVGTSAVAVLGSNCVGGRRRGSRDRELGREMGACSVLVRVVRVAHQHQRCRVLVVLWVTQLADGSVSSPLHLPPPSPAGLLAYCSQANGQCHRDRRVQGRQCSALRLRVPEGRVRVV